jgi:Flp pilus assembly CpaF family ATPase
MKNTEFKIPDKEAILQTEQINKAGTGDEAAQLYLLELIKLKLTRLLETKDLQIIKETIKDEYDIFLNKKYQLFEENSKYISYYQLLSDYMIHEQKIILENTKLSEINGLDEFAELMFQNTYGNNVLEALLKLKLNTIEIHGTRKIIVETYKGKSKTIYGYRYLKDDDIITTATHLMSMGDNPDITEDNCEQTGMMPSKGYRVDVALKPGCKENMIFVKKFDAGDTKTIETLIELNTITKEMGHELGIFAKGRVNMGFDGGINTGKTVTARAYVGLIPDEIKLGIVGNEFETDWPTLYPEKDIVSLQKTKKYDMSAQLIKLLRCNRNSLCIEEARSFEIEQWIEACSRGGDGGFLTLHSIRAHDFINNVAWMCLKSGVPQDIRVLRYRIASAIDIITRMWQTPEGNRIVDEITEVITVHDNLDIPYILNPLYKRNIATNKVEKVGNISSDLQEKLAYYNVSYEEIQSIIDPSIKSREGD